MSDDDKGFLTRWSQRKHEANQPDRDPPAAGADPPSVPVAEGDALPEFDLSNLPKLEELTATTDITGFLRKGVPEHLRNAALRKSWALDPAIRDYVNPALDYAYDWNTPGGVPGNSAIGAGTDVARMVLQIMGSGEPVTEPSASAAVPADERAGDAAQSPDRPATPETGRALPTQAIRQSSETISMAQEASTEEGPRTETRQVEHSAESNSVAPQQAGVRRHGSAKPLD